jgi:hypothetical protein
VLWARTRVAAAALAANANVPPMNERRLIMETAGAG